MNRTGALVLAVAATVLVSVARSGHELPIYPSFYPHEIEIRTLASDAAAAALRAGKIQAHIGDGLSLEGAPADQVQAISSLGAFVVVRLNPQSPLATDDGSACAALSSVALQAAQTGRFVVHPYPVTPFHGDYLHHADRAADAKRILLEQPPVPHGLRVRAGAGFIHPAWSARETDWDVEVADIDAAALVMAATFEVNGFTAPPWLRAGWFHAERLLAQSDPALRQHLEPDLQRLRSGEVARSVARINLEREVVTGLTRSCRIKVAGYTVKREFVNVEYSAGIENIGYDAIEGLRSPIFIRTVKLKDFPWNGWLALGIGSTPAAAWNPIGGMTDPFGRLMGFAVTDSALLPAPYEASWMLNRISDVADQGRSQ